MRGLFGVSRLQGLPTHGHLWSQLCCTLYTLIARRLLAGAELEDAYTAGSTALRALLTESEAAELERLLARREPGKGSGFVVDSLWSALDAVEKTDSFENAIQYAVALGNDTDTTACIAGGLAGALYGEAAIPARWIEQLHGKQIVEKLLAHLAGAEEPAV
jgi:ADP-ribosylglycohydrolase